MTHHHHQPDRGGSRIAVALRFVARERDMVLLTITVLAVLTATAVVLIDATVADAATSQISKNAGDEAKSWATGLLLPLAALCGLGAFLKRDIGAGLILAFLTIILGGFALAPGAVRSVISGLWQAMGGGGGGGAGGAF